MRYFWVYFIFGSLGCSSWELTYPEKTLSDCWFSTDVPTPVEGGLDWGITTDDMNVGYDFPYDGIDQNCDGAAEFDLDGDGFLPAPFAVGEEVDCWDVIPSPLEEITGEMISFDQEDQPYDGIDQNCDGVVDFDQDEDGYGSDAYVGSALYKWNPDFSQESLDLLKESIQGLDDAEKQLAIDSYFLSFVEDLDWRSGDCWDDPQEERIILNDFSTISAVDVQPDAEERFYDGVDQNCDDSSDFDQDGDGFDSMMFPKEDGDIGDDCNDMEADLFPNPEIEEIYYNGIDDNCDARDEDGDQDGDGFWDTDYFLQVSEDDIDVSVQLPEDDLFSDCNDLNAQIYPDAEERCNGLDDSCDGALPEREQDQDADGYVTCVIEDTGWEGEHTPDLHDMFGGDCDDGDAFVYPSAAEIFGDGVDQSCDGLEICYLDNDLDGFRGESTIESPNLDCSGVGQMSASLDVDCDDGSSDTYPGAAYNDSSSDCMRDGDGDGYGSDTVSGDIVPGSDCDDILSSINPDAIEVCDSGVDNDCDGQSDDDDVSLDISTATEHFADVDEDGYGDANDTDVSCIVPTERTTDDTDCDDGDATINPQTIWYLDSDADGFGGLSTQVICIQPSNHVLVDGDCNDSDGGISPSALEIVADGIDQNCDTLELCYVDADEDSYGEIGTIDSIAFDYTCAAPGVSNLSTDCDDGSFDTHPGAAYNESSSDCMRDEDGDGFGSMIVSSGVTPGSDCDDVLSSINPDAIEVCDSGVDNDCDGQSDDDDVSLDISTATEHFADVDEDGYGDANDTDVSCIVPTERTTDDGDCNDGDAAINPQTIWYVDSDGDGFGSSTQTTVSCLAPTGFINNDEDCDDGNINITTGWVWYIDSDGDGIGDANDTQIACVAPSGYVHHNGDCDDGNPTMDSICLDLWSGVSIEGAGSGDLSNNDRDRFANQFSMGSLNGTNYFGFGMQHRKYDNTNNRGGVFLFDDLLEPMSTDERSVQIDPVSSTIKFLGQNLVLGLDITGDGGGDLLVNAFTSPPSLYVFDGIDIDNAAQNTGFMEDQDALYTIDGSTLSDRMGRRVFWEDITGDGQTDLIFDLYKAQSICIIHNGISDLTLQNTTVSSEYFFLKGQDPADNFGYDFDMFDIDLDGQMDMVVSDKRFDGENGRLYVRLGPILPDPTSVEVPVGMGDLYIDSDSTNSKPRFGEFVQSFDLDTDGYRELVVLEKRDNASQYIYFYDFDSLATVSGASSVSNYLASHTSLTSSVAASFVLTSPVKNEFNILSMDMIDGYLAIGAPMYNGQKGVVALFEYEDRLATHGPTGREVVFNEANAHRFIYINTSTANRVGSLVKNIGDVTGDGHDDLLVGSRMENSGEGVVRIIPGPF